MVDTPIFSIFHRGPPPPAPPAPTPVASAPEPSPLPSIQTAPPAAPVPAPAAPAPAQTVAQPPPEPTPSVAPEPPAVDSPAEAAVPQEVEAPAVILIVPPEPDVAEPDVAEPDSLSAPEEPEVDYHIAAPQHGNAELETDDQSAPEGEPSWINDIELPIDSPEEHEEEGFYLEPESPPYVPPAEVSVAEVPVAEVPVAEVPVAEEPVAEEPLQAWEAPSHDLEAETAAAPWQGPTEFNGIPVGADQLGLANPIIITLLARLKDSSTIELDASQTGIYRPQRFRVAPWSGFPYDQAENGRTGLAAGTRILTSRGEMEVERLLPGDTALALRTPKLMPIAWIGRSNATVAPVLIEAGALGPDLPRRALCLAPDQAVFVDPVPVPVAQLVNGTTIRMLDTDDIDLFHVDVGSAEILFAEGLPLSSSDRARVQGAG